MCLTCLCGPDNKRESKDGDWFTAHSCENWELKNEANNKTTTTTTKIAHDLALSTQHLLLACLKF